LLFLFFFLILTELALYLHFYHHHYPQLYSSQWQYGYQQVVDYIEENKDRFDYVYLTNEYGRAYMYYLFYSQMEPEECQRLVKPFRHLPDIPQLGKVFIGQPPLEKGRTLWIVEKQGKEELLKTIKFLDGQGAFYLWEK